MIRTRIVLREDETLEKMSVTGHAHSGPPGNDTICAAVSALIRTAVRTLEAHEGLEVVSEAPEPGIVHIQVSMVSETEKGWLKGVSDMVRMGLWDIKHDAPEHIVVEEERSNRHGS